MINYFGLELDELLTLLVQKTSVYIGISSGDENAEADVVNCERDLCEIQEAIAIKRAAVPDYIFASKTAGSVSEPLS
jgi:hypothetical protein